MGCMTCPSISAMSILGHPMTPPNLLAMPFATGGHNMVHLTITRQIQFCFCVMVEGVIVHVNICSNKICKHWLMNWGLKFALPTIHLTPRAYNPIEHRLFPHLTRVCQGVIFESIEMVKDLMAKAKTKTGLKVFTSVLNQVYETGRQVSQEFKQTMEIRPLARIKKTGQVHS